MIVVRALLFVFSTETTGIFNLTNVGPCVAIEMGKECGPGQQRQTGLCLDGTKYKCTVENIEQLVTCDEAKTSLPKCPGRNI